MQVSWKAVVVQTRSLVTMAGLITIAQRNWPIPHSTTCECFQTSHVLLQRGGAGLEAADGLRNGCLRMTETTPLWNSVVKNVRTRRQTLARESGSMDTGVWHVEIDDEWAGLLSNVTSRKIVSPCITVSLRSRGNRIISNAFDGRYGRR